MATLQLILDGALDSVQNMASDAFLLQAANSRARSTLRIYRWRQPSLSLGYFQRYVDRAEHSASSACPVVRRASGGGAILHHHELTYSLTTPVRDRLSATQTSDTYDRLHASVIQALRRFDVSAEPYQGSPQASSFLCFQRRASGDIVMGPWKVMGSAQRRFRQAILQHGSLIFRRSPFAPELPGIEDLAEKTIDQEDFVKTWSKLVADEFGLELRAAKFTPAETDQIKSIGREKFSQNGWLHRR